MTLTTVRSPRALAPMLGVPPRTLFQLCTDPNRYYLPAKFKEREGRPPRRIDRPRAILKRVQRRVHDLILKTVTLPDYLHGGVPGHSPRTLAKHHLRKACVVKIDVRDFFPSIDRAFVERVLRREVHAGRQVARTLACVLTRGCETDPRMTFLPQGSPCSSTVANLALLGVERGLRAHATRIGVRYDRSTDDIIMSGPRVREMIPIVVGTLAGTKLKVSREKLRVMPKSGAQVAVGLTLNRKPAPARAFREKCLALLDEIRTEEHPQRRLKQMRRLRGMLGHAKSCAGSFARRLEIRMQGF